MDQDREYNIVRTDVFESEIAHQIVSDHPAGAAALRRLAKLVNVPVNEDRIKSWVSFYLHLQHGGLDTDDMVAISKCGICNKPVDTSSALPVEPATRGRAKLFKD